MAAYGVPDELDGLLPWSWADERLTKSRNFWVVTATLEARPHALPAWGVWVSELERFAFSCAPTLRQSAYFRPHNKDARIPGLYLVGAGTHPGAGVPGVINGAKEMPRPP